MQNGEPGGPEQPKPYKEPGPEPDRAQQMADDAIAAGKRLMETETGRKVADAADTGFNRAGALIDNVLDNPTGQKLKDGTDNLLARGGPMLSSGLGRNMAIGAGAGAVAGLVLPFFGSIFGAAVGAGLGYLRTITKK